MQTQLRDYQEKAIANVTEEFFTENGAYRQLGVAATGAGKTVMFSHLWYTPQMQEWLAQYPVSQRKMLVVAHREELLEQAADKLQAANPDAMVAIEKAERHAPPMADIVVASVQTLSRSGKRLGKFDSDDFRIVICDEAHRSTAQSYMKVWQHFGFLPPDDYKPRPEDMTTKEEALEWQRVRLGHWDLQHKRDKLLLGVTATPKRSDNVGLEAVFQKIVFSETIRDLVVAGYLVKPRAIRVQSETGLDEVSTRAGDFAIDELSEAVDNQARNQLAVKAWKEHAEGRPAVAFCASVEHAQHMSAAFDQAGIPARAVFGEMPHDERKAAFVDYKNGKLTLLTNNQLLTEGWDEPRVECVIMARPTKSSLVMTQAIGRGLRLNPLAGKEDCLIIDICDVTKRHQLVTAPDLFGLPADFDAKGEDLVALAKKVEDIAAANPMAFIGDAKSLDEIQYRVEQVDFFSPEDNALIKGSTSLAFIQTGETFVLGWPSETGQENLVIKQDTLGKWQTTFTRPDERDSRRKATISEVVATTGELKQAFHEAERWLMAFRPNASRMKDMGASWRQHPPSEGQLSYLKRYAPASFDRTKLKTITKGQASDLIELFKTKRGRAA